MLTRLFLLYLSTILSASAYTLTADDPELTKRLEVCPRLFSLRLPAFPDKKSEIGFQMHYWLSKPIDPSQKSLVLIPGGPGQTFHKMEWVKSNNINIIYFDPRGMGCSTPLNDKLLNNPDFYSSKYVAHDLEQLRQHLGISKWSIYGHSFGTIAASIYASLYPAATDTLILEGTIYSGGTELWYSPARKQLLQKVISTLPLDVQNKILSFETYNINSVWFSQVLLDELPSGFDRDRLRQRIDRYFRYRSKQTSSKIYTPRVFTDVTPYFSRNAHLILSCKELAADVYSPARLFSFDGNEFQYLENYTYSSECAEWEITKEIYTVKDYSINVPTFYFHGEFDYLTTLDDAKKHFEQNQSSKKVFLTLKYGGHQPFLSSMNEFNKGNPLRSVYEELLERILTHKSVELGLVGKSKSLHQEWIVETGMSSRSVVDKSNGKVF